MVTPAAHPDRSQLARQIGRWSLVALVVNAIIGSGIFGLPSVIAGLLSGYSPLAYLITAVGTAAIVGCFAEVGSRFQAAGGPYLYARAVFGPFVGIQIAWLTLLARATAAAANVNLFVAYLGGFWQSASHPAYRLTLITLIVGILALINYRSIGRGAQVSNFLAIAKIVPLLLVGAAGIISSRAIIQPGSVVPPTSNWMDAVLLLMYAYGGSEAALIPLGEAKDPRKDAPFALFTGLAVVTLIYSFVQIAVVGVLPSPATTERPVADVAAALWGPTARSAVSVAALVCMYGYLSSMVLSCPRLTFALAEQGDFPAKFAAIHRKFGTPHISIVFFSALVWGVSAIGSFKWNVALSAIARLFTYCMICAALLALRKRGGPLRRFELPAGSVVATFGLVFSLGLITRIRSNEVAIVFATAAIALVNWTWAKRRRARLEAAAPGSVNIATNGSTPATKVHTVYR